MRHKPRCCDELPTYTDADQGPSLRPTQGLPAPALPPLLQLQNLIGNAGVLELLRPHMPGAQPDTGPAPLTGRLQSVHRQEGTTPTPPPGGTRAPTTAVGATFADQGGTAGLALAPSSPAPPVAEPGTAPPDVQTQPQAQDAWQPSWWNEAVDWTVGGVVASWTAA